MDYFSTVNPGVGVTPSIMHNYDSCQALRLIPRKINGGFTWEYGPPGRGTSSETNHHFEVLCSSSGTQKWRFGLVQMIFRFNWIGWFLLIFRFQPFIFQGIPIQKISPTGPTERTLAAATYLGVRLVRSHSIFDATTNILVFQCDKGQMHLNVINYLVASPKVFEQHTQTNSGFFCPRLEILRLTIRVNRAFVP